MNRPQDSEDQILKRYHRLILKYQVLFTLRWIFPASLLLYWSILVWPISEREMTGLFLSYLLARVLMELLLWFQHRQLHLFQSHHPDLHLQCVPSCKNKNKKTKFRIPL